MYRRFEEDIKNQNEILREVLEEAESFFERRAEGMPAPIFEKREPRKISDEGLGAKETLSLLKEEYVPYMSLNSGARFFGFVIGGATPAALAGDWLTSLYDQNAFGLFDRVDRQIEIEATEALKDLLGLPNDYSGVFTSGATMANITALAVAREWAAQREGKSANDGVYGLTLPKIVSGAPHASLYKGLSVLGLGRNAMIELPCIVGRESVDVARLEEYLSQNKDEAVIVIANMGTANSGDVDDLAGIAALKEKYDFYLHVDGAVGALAAASPKYKNIFAGLDKADSFTVDAHKWLNVPYDSAISFVRGEELREYQYRVFAQAASVQNQVSDAAPFYDLCPEGSRRMRALSVWMSLYAYGKKGYIDIVERDCEMAQRLANKLTESPYIRLCNDVRLNGFAFTLKIGEEYANSVQINEFAGLIRKDGATFMNTAQVMGMPAVRCSISNYATGENEIDAAAKSIIACAQKICEKGK